MWVKCKLNRRKSDKMADFERVDLQVSQLYSIFAPELKYDN